MGRYCSQATIVPSLMTESLVAQLTHNGDASAVTIDTDVLDDLIEDAEAEVDGYLGHRYALPLPSVPTLIARLSARITRYRLYTASPGDPDEWLTNDYKNAVTMLEHIRDGSVSLGLTALGADPGASGATGRRVRATSEAPVFGRANLKDF